MKVEYEWLPDNEKSEYLRRELAELFGDAAQHQEDLCIQLDCPACRNRLCQSAALLRRWARELTDRRRRRVPMLSRADWTPGHRVPFTQIVSELLEVAS